MSSFDIYPLLDDVCLNDPESGEFPPLFEDLKLYIPDIPADDIVFPSLLTTPIDSSAYINYSPDSSPISFSPSSPSSSSSCSSSPMQLSYSPIKEEPDLKTPKSAPARKRSRVTVRASTTLPEVITIVTVSREKILEWSSAEMDEFVMQKRAEIGREFTGEELKEIKRQRRLIKNRESALASRLRKKAELDQLSQEVTQRLHSMQEKDARIAFLEKENDQLKHEVHRLRGILEAREPQTSLVQTVTHTFQGLGHHARNLLSVGAERDAKKPTSALYLMAVLFSFAFFIGLPAMHSQAVAPLLPHATPSFVLPGLLDDPVPLIKADAPSSLTPAPLPQLQPDSFSKRSPLSFSLDFPPALNLDHLIQKNVSSQSPKSIYELSSELSSYSLPQLTPETPTTPIFPRFLCNNKTEIGVGVDLSDSFTISLLVPEQILKSQQSSDSNSFFEVTCSLISQDS